MAGSALPRLAAMVPRQSKSRAEARRLRRSRRREPVRAVVRGRRRRSTASATIRAMRARRPSASYGQIVPLMRSSAAPNSGLVSMESTAEGSASSSVSP